MMPIRSELSTPASPGDPPDFRRAQLCCALLAPNLRKVARAAGTRLLEPSEGRRFWPCKLAEKSEGREIFKVHTLEPSEGWRIFRVQAVDPRDLFSVCTLSKARPSGRKCSNAPKMAEPSKGSTTCMQTRGESFGRFDDLHAKNPPTFRRSKDLHAKNPRTFRRPEHLHAKNLPTFGECDQENASASLGLRKMGVKWSLIYCDRPAEWRNLGLGRLDEPGGSGPRHFCTFCIRRPCDSSSIASQDRRPKKMRASSWGSPISACTLPPSSQSRGRWWR